MSGTEWVKKFWSKVDKTRSCWNWTGCLSAGYGRFSRPGKKKLTTLAHRISFELINGKINQKLVIDHKCRNRACVNPKHLREVTQSVNALENSMNPLALHKKKTHCKSGHRLSGKNLKFKNHKGSKVRVCILCDKKYQKKYRDKLK